MGQYDLDGKCPYFERMFPDQPLQVEDRSKADEAAVNAYPDDNPKTMIGLTKPSMSPVPPAALLHLMQAMTDGKRKYGLMNWREKKVSASIYYDAAMRHLMAFWDGEDKASDSGVHHLGHAMACCCLILDAAACGNLNDDRPKAGSFSELAAAMTKKLEEK